MTTQTSNPVSVAVLGVGRMGAGLARALLDRGHRTTVWNRTAARAAPLAERGAQLAATVRDAVAAADVIIVNVSEYTVSNPLLQAPDVAALLRGKSLVQLTSGTPRQARELATWSADHQIKYLDGAIMSTPDHVGTPSCTILYSGPTEIFEQLQPVLAALGNTMYLGRDPGQASTLDLAALTYMWGALFGITQGAALCAAENFPLPEYLKLIRGLLPLVDGWVVDNLERTIDGRLAGDAATLASIETHHATVRHLVAVCAERGVSGALPAVFDRVMGAAITAGHGGDDFAMLSKFLR